VGTEPGRIEPRLSAFDTTMLVVSLVIGIGIFRTPAMVAGGAGTSALFFAAWVLGGLVSLIGALTYAEIGSRFPRAGGYYKVVAECYHPALAFMLNWAQALLQGAGAAGVAFIGAEYLNLLLLPPARRTPGAVLTTACVLMLVLLALNHAGIRTGARTQNVLSVLKIAMILGLAAAAFLARVPAPVPPAAAASGSGAGFLAACVAVFYAYGGYQNTMNVGGDVRDPRRSLPLASGAAWRSWWPSTSSSTSPTITCWGWRGWRARSWWRRRWRGRPSDRRARPWCPWPSSSPRPAS